MWKIIEEVKPRLEPVDVTTDAKRNPHREIKFMQKESEETKRGKDIKRPIIEEDDGPIVKPEPLLKEGSIEQIWSQLEGEGGHTEVIRSIQYISCTDVPLIMTASLDRKVRIFSMAQSQAERDHGTLKQGYKMLPKYHWDFPCSVHEGNAAARLTQTYKKLEAERKKRDFDLSKVKKKEIELFESGKLSTLGFAGSQLMGMGATTGSLNQSAGGLKSMYNTN